MSERERCYCLWCLEMINKAEMNTARPAEILALLIHKQMKSEGKRDDRP